MFLLVKLVPTRCGEEHGHSNYSGRSRTRVRRPFMPRSFQEETLQICGAILSPSPPSRLPSTPRRLTASPVPPHVRPLAVVATPTLALKPPLEVGARLLEAAPSTCLQLRRGKDSSVPVASMAVSTKAPALELGIITAVLITQ